MDVRCERCRTEYELDEAKISEAGVAVRCTSCGFVFKVTKQVPAPAGRPPGADEFPAELSSVDKTREWKIRQVSGNMFTCRELTTLQKWIVERKVSREDEISLIGDSWKRLGNIPELAGFFLVVEQAAKAQLYEQQAQMAHVPAAVAPMPASMAVVPSAPMAVPMPSVMVAPAVMGAAAMNNQVSPAMFHPGALMPQGWQLGQPSPAPAEPAWTQPAAPATPPVRTPAPAAAPRYDDLDDLDADLRAIRGGGKGKWVFLLLALLAGGGVGYYFLVLHPEKPAAPAPLAAAPALAPTPAPAAPAAPPAPVPAPAPAPVVAAPAPTPVVAPVPAEPAKPAPEVAKEVVTKEVVTKEAATKAATKKEPAGDAAGGKEPKARKSKSYNALIIEAARLHERDKAQAALDDYLQAIDQRPDSAEAWSGKGQCLIDLDRAPEAQEAFEKALSLSPEFADAQLGLAESLKYQGKKAQAIKYYKIYLDAHPSGDGASVATNAIKELSE